MSRAKARGGDWCVAALLMGAMTQLVAGQATAQRPAAAPTSGATRSVLEAKPQQKALARSKLLQARAELSQGRFDDAERLANEAGRLHSAWSSVEDSPTKLLLDARSARQDPRALLVASRSALARKDYSSAEKYARASDRLSGVLTFTPWGDSPRKVLEEIQKAQKPTQVKAATPPTPASRTATPSRVNAPAHAIRPAESKTAIVQASHTAPGQTVAKPVNGPTPGSAASPAEKAVVGSRMPAPPANKTAPTNENDDARQVMKQAREAIARKDYGRARDLVAVARQMKTNFSWWEDTPDKIESDIRRAAPTSRTAPPPAAKTTTSAKAPTPAPVHTSAAKPPAARPGPVATPTPVVTSQQPAKPAATARPTPTPAPKDSVKPTPTSTSTATVKTPPAPAAPAKNGIPRTKEEARTLLTLGRRQLAEGKLDEAAQTSQRVKAQGHVSWGLFEDSPDRLALDIDKARTVRDRAESVRLLAEGRKLYAAGDYEAASRMAYRAQKLHGSYNIWDLGDRPSKLLGDVQTARAKLRRTALPPATVARKDEKAEPARPAGNASLLAKLTGTGTNTTPPARPTSPPMASKPVGTTKPVAPTALVNARPTPSAILQDTASTTPTPAPAPVVSTQPVPEAPSPERLRAQQLVAEAQRLLREGKQLDLARDKALEAQKLNVRFGPDETSPEFVYQQIAIVARQRVDGLVRSAQDAVAYGQGDATARSRDAEVKLEEARTLAAGFGQDTRPIESRLAEVRSMKAPPAPTPTPSPIKDSAVALVTNPPRQASTPTFAPTTKPAPTPTPVAAPTPVAPPAPIVTAGQKLLEDARLELRKGETANARRLAETALTAHHGVKNDAMALLRTIDAEEFNQKQLATNRSFDAALSAYRRREYGRASAMIAAIDVRLLDNDRQGRLREIAMTPEMSQPQGLARATDRVPTPPAGIVRTGASDVASSPTLNASTPSAPVPVPGIGTGRAVVSDTASPADNGLLDRHKQMQKVLFEKLRQEGLDAQREAADKFRAGQSDQALELLSDYLVRLNDEKLEPGQLTLLRRPVESRVSHFRLLKAQKDLAAGVLASKQAHGDRMQAKFKAEEIKHKNVEKLMKDFNTLFKEGKYLEAESLAMRALELDPDNGVASAAVYMARRQRDVSSYRKIKDGRERYNLEALNDAEKEPGADAIDKGVSYDQDRWNQASRRKPSEPLMIGKPSEKHKAIERQLSTPISISFDNTPLKQVLDELRDVHGINIVPDLPAMQEAGISVESPISIKLDRVSLKSSLNLILHQVRLTHVIKDEVLMITTEENAKGKLQTVSYAVADLVIPVENFGDVRNGGNPNRPAASPAVTNNGATPYYGPNAITTGQNVGAPSGNSMLSGSGRGSPGMSGSGTSTTKHGPTNTTEEQLIKLITSTIQPRTWSEMGGPGTIEYFPLTMSLVINQAADIQEQIGELLGALRRLQDQEVAVEVRFISVSEDFFERVGVNFNMNVQTKNYRYEPALQSNAFVFDNLNFINAFRPDRMLAGATPAGTLTPTLDIPIQQNSFVQTVPNFGGYAPGGLTMGLAFLSDIQVFLFLEAAQGDVRANVMQAPKLTLFNGQTSTLTVNDQQSFVGGVQIAQVGGGQFAIVPQVNPQFNGVNLTIQAVISADRRYVRLSMTPSLTNLLPGPIQTFPVVVPIFTSIEGNQAGQPVVFTQLIQQPIQTTISIQTTVAVPDGGTVLMGGLKRLSEARSEYGPPILSKVPYINRLFKNVGYGRETDSMMIMVTPRIIVQAEEEERQTGFSSAAAGSAAGS